MLLRAAGWRPRCLFRCDPCAAHARPARLPVAVRAARESVAGEGAQWVRGTGIPPARAPNQVRIRSGIRPTRPHGGACRVPRTRTSEAGRRPRVNGKRQGSGMGMPVGGAGDGGCAQPRPLRAPAYRGARVCREDQPDPVQLVEARVTQSSCRVVSQPVSPAPPDAWTGSRSSGFNGQPECSVPEPPPFVCQISRYRVTPKRHPGDRLRAL